MMALLLADLWQYKTQTRVQNLIRKIVQPQNISEGLKYILFNAGGKVKFWKDLGRLSILKAY